MRIDTLIFLLSIMLTALLILVQTKDGGKIKSDRREVVVNNNHYFRVTISQSVSQPFINSISMSVYHTKDQLIFGDEVSQS